MSQSQGGGADDPQAKDIEQQIAALQAQLKSLQNVSQNSASDALSSTLGADQTHHESESDQILIVVANRLPVSMKFANNEWTFKPSAGGLVTALKQLGNLDMEWVGCAEFIESGHRDYIKQRLLDYNVHPVFVEKRDYDNYYNGFCNGILWPLFHYIELNDEIIVPYFNKFYTAYSRINLLFARAIDELVQKLEAKMAALGRKKEILIWVHDYHLMLCPNYIRRFRRDIQIGFFLHIPFPTWEQFRVLPKADHLLQGVLACNLVSFHIHDYAQHFRGACSHILQCELAPDGVIYHGRMSMISTHPIGTDIGKWRRGLQNPQIQALIHKYQQVHRDKTIILGVDRLDFIKGIPHKLYAYQKFLEDNPGLREKVVFIQIAVPSRQYAPEYIKLTKKCNELVGKINAKYASFSSVPIHFLYQSFGFNDLVALYHISKVCYVTSLRDGMNLVSFEYISCQSMEDPGVLIVSEFAGSAQSLGCGSLVVNPWNCQQTAEALQTALTMDQKQRQTHQEICSKIISNNTVQHWATEVISALRVSYEKCPLNAPIVPSPCSLSTIAKSFQSRPQNRLIILGLGGTVIPSISKYSNVNLHEYASMKKVSSRAVEAINKLALSDNCTVAILSSLPRSAIEVLLDGVHCIQYAENGYFMRDWSINSKNQRWQITTNYTDTTWKEQVFSIMNYFQERTPNTTLDNLTSFVCFRYNNNLQSSASSSSSSARNISQCVASLQTGPLQSSYARLMHDSSLGHIQVRQPGVSKLSSITRLIQKLSAQTPFDYVLCIANFLSFDEEVFVYLNGLQDEYTSSSASSSQRSPSPATDGPDGAATFDAAAVSTPTQEEAQKSARALHQMYPSTDVEKVRFSAATNAERNKLQELTRTAMVDTIKVGRYATRAKYYVHDERKVGDILHRLSQIVMSEQYDGRSSPEVSPDKTSGGLSSMRNWSVGSDLSRLAETIDDDLGAENEQKIDSSAMPGLGADKWLTGAMHDIDENRVAPAGLISIPPTHPSSSDSDYGSFDDDHDEAAAAKQPVSTTSHPDSKEIKVLPKGKKLENIMVDID